MSECVYCLQKHEGDCKREDLEKALDIYEKRRFYNQMADHWTSENYAIDDRLHAYICEIKKKLKEL